jgi:CBS domain-containing protein
MSNSKVVKDLMIDVFEFPHIPYWFSIRQAIGIIKKSLLTKEKCLQPMAVLVFDEKYNLVGTVSLKDILRGLEPRFLKPTTKAQGHAGDDPGLSSLWDTMFSKESKEMAEKPISDVMAPAKSFVAPEDPITKAAYLMVHNDLALLPVLENNKKFVGLVRMIEVFDELSNTILEGRG